MYSSLTPRPASIDRHLEIICVALVPVALLILAACAGCSSRRAVACASDLDCGGSTSCDRGDCVTPRAARSPDLRPRRIALAPRDDSTVLSSTCCRTTSYGDHDVLLVGGGGDDGIYRSYLRFELPRLENERLVRAHLRLVTRPRWSEGDEPLEILAYATSSDWTQGGLTWTSQPRGSGSPVGRAVVRPAHSGETILDLTSLVQRWSASTTSDHAIVLKASREHQDLRIAWSSSESPDEGSRPRLDVEVQ